MRATCSTAASGAAGDRVRVSVQLTEATTGRLVWSETYNAEIEGIFAVQDTIAKRVVGAAAVELTRFEQERVLAKPTSNLAAYEYVLRGRGALSHDTRDSNDEASALFQRAIDLDPNYADAYAALGRRIFEAVVSGWSEFRAEDLERAEALAQKALALDPATTRAYQVLSSYQSFQKALRSRAGANRPRARVQSERCRQLCLSRDHLGVGGSSRGGIAVVGGRTPL